MSDDEAERDGLCSLTDAVVRRMTGDRRRAFYDEHGGWEAAFTAAEAMPGSSQEKINDLAVVLSACAAVKRLMELVENEACESADFAARIRHAITVEAPVDVKWPGAGFGMAGVLDFLLRVAEETQTSTQLGVRVCSSLGASVLGETIDDQTDG